MPEPKCDEMVAPGVRYAFGQYHAVYTAKGRIKSRYFDSLRAAIRWRDRGIAKERERIKPKP